MLQQLKLHLTSSLRGGEADAAIQGRLERPWIAAPLSAARNDDFC